MKLTISTRISLRRVSTSGTRASTHVFLTTGAFSTSEIMSRDLFLAVCPTIRARALMGDADAARGITTPAAAVVVAKRPGLRGLVFLAEGSLVLDSDLAR